MTDDRPGDYVRWLGFALVGLEKFDKSSEPNSVKHFYKIFVACFFRLATRLTRERSEARERGMRERERKRESESESVRAGLSRVSGLLDSRSSVETKRPFFFPFHSRLGIENG